MFSCFRAALGWTGRGCGWNCPWPQSCQTPSSLLNVVHTVAQYTFSILLYSILQSSFFLLHFILHKLPNNWNTKKLTKISDIILFVLIITSFILCKPTKYINYFSEIFFFIHLFIIIFISRTRQGREGTVL